jgi:hypothetical protein
MLSLIEIFILNKRLMFYLMFISFFLYSLNAQEKNDFYISNSGSRPSLAIDSQGRVYVTWQNWGDAIYLKQYNQSGNQISDSLKFPYTNASETPRLAIDNENVGIVWNDRLSTIQDFYKTFITGDIFKSGSTSDSVDFIFVDDIYANYYRQNPDITFLTDTIVVVVWNGNGDSTVSQQGIYAQISTANGDGLGKNILINAHIGSQINSYGPRVFHHKGDNYFVVSWVDNSLGHNALYARKFDTSRVALGPSILVSNDSSMIDMFYYSAAQDENGNIVFLWIADKGKKSQMEWRWYSDSLFSLTNVEQLTPLDTLFDSGNSIDISVDQDGKSIAVWEQRTSTKNRYVIVGQRYGSDKEPIGNNFIISLDDTTSSELYPKVKICSENLCFIWQTGSSGIKGRFGTFDSVTLAPAMRVREIPSKIFSLDPNYPNPFNPSTIISFKLYVVGNVELTIYTTLGKKINVLLKDNLKQGYYSYMWNGENSCGDKLPSGVYFAQLKVGGYVKTQKLLLVK